MSQTTIEDRYWGVLIGLAAGDRMALLLAEMCSTVAVSTLRKSCQRSMYVSGTIFECFCGMLARVGLELVRLIIWRRR